MKDKTHGGSRTSGLNKIDRQLPSMESGGGVTWGDRLVKKKNSGRQTTSRTTEKTNMPGVVSRGEMDYVDTRWKARRKRKTNLRVKVKQRKKTHGVPEWEIYVKLG